MQYKLLVSDFDNKEHNFLDFMKEVKDFKILEMIEIIKI